MAIDRRFSVAPMMDCTDRHGRYFLRLISARTLLYTEMVTTGAVIHGDRARLLGFSPSERPLALQLGGHDPDQLARATALAEAWGYDEVNLNVGCPSDRVKCGQFGAALMAEPGRVARAVGAMREATRLPVTVKCRIGIDDDEPAVVLPRFIETVAGAGATTFIVHARKALLAGLSPKENREIPPLDYKLVYAMKERFPALEIVINGGVASIEGARAHLGHVDGVMLGRAAYHNPYILATVDRDLFGDDRPVPTLGEIIEGMVVYARAQTAAATPLHRITRHMLGLMQGRPGARAWRRHLAEASRAPGADAEVIEEAARRVDLTNLEQAA